MQVLKVWFYLDLEEYITSAAVYDVDVSLLAPTMNLKEGVSTEEVGLEVKQAYVGDGSFAEDIGALVRVSCIKKSVLSL